MKKAFYLLATVALMAGCTQGEVLVDTENQTTEVARSIGFETFVDKATRATGTNSTALNDFYPTFHVYGWKTVFTAECPMLPRNGSAMMYTATPAAVQAAGFASLLTALM